MKIAGTVVMSRRAVLTMDTTLDIAKDLEPSVPVIDMGEHTYIYLIERTLSPFQRSLMSF